MYTTSITQSGTIRHMKDGRPLYDRSREIICKDNGDYEVVIIERYKDDYTSYPPFTIQYEDIRQCILEKIACKNKYDQPLLVAKYEEEAVSILKCDAPISEYRMKKAAALSAISHAASNSVHYDNPYAGILNGETN